MSFDTQSTAQAKGCKKRVCILRQKMNQLLIPLIYIPSSAMIKWLLSSSIKQANTSRLLAPKSATSALRRGISISNAWQAAKFILVGTRLDKLCRTPKVLFSIFPRDEYLDKYWVLGFCWFQDKINKHTNKPKSEQIDSWLIKCKQQVGIPGC